MHHLHRHQHDFQWILLIVVTIYRWLRAFHTLTLLIVIIQFNSTPPHTHLMDLNYIAIHSQLIEFPPPFANPNSSIPSADVIRMLQVRIAVKWRQIKSIL